MFGESKSSCQGFPLTFCREEVVAVRGTGSGRTLEGYNTYNQALSAWEYSGNNRNRPPPPELLPYPFTAGHVSQQLPHSSCSARSDNTLAFSCASRSVGSASSGPHPFTASAVAHQPQSSTCPVTGPSQPRAGPSQPRAGPSMTQRSVRDTEDNGNYWVIIRGRAPGVYTNM